MATSTNIKELLPRLLGIFPATLERQIRALLLARMLPLGKRGGGKGAAHYGAAEFVTILLGQAGMLPSDAPDAVQALRSLPFRGQSRSAQDVGNPRMYLEEMLAYWIKTAGSARRIGSEWFAEDEALIKSWTMQLCVNPSHAIITIDLPGGQNTIVYASAEDGEMPAQAGIRRLTVIYGDVLLALGELLADTEKQITPPPSSFLDQVSAKTPPENENTGISCQGEPVFSKSQPTQEPTAYNCQLQYGTNIVCGDMSDVSGEPLRSQANIPVLVAGHPPENHRRSQCPTSTLFA